MDKEGKGSFEKVTLLNVKKLDKTKNIPLLLNINKENKIYYIPIIFDIILFGDKPALDKWINNKCPHKYIYMYYVDITSKQILYCFDIKQSYKLTSFNIIWNTELKIINQEDLNLYHHKVIFINKNIENWMVKHITLYTQSLINDNNNNNNYYNILQ